MIVVLNSDVFGQNVFYNRVFQNISQEDFAAQIKISVSMLEQIEAGSLLYIEESILSSISRVLDVPLEELLNG